MVIAPSHTQNEETLPDSSRLADALWEPPPVSEFQAFGAERLRNSVNSFERPMLPSIQQNALAVTELSSQLMALLNKERDGKHS